MLDHLALQVWMFEHGTQPPELKPELPKLKPLGAKSSLSGVRELKLLELKPLTLELKPLELEPQPPQAHAGSLDQPFTGSWGLCLRSWGGLGPHVGDLGPLLGLCRRSWVALGDAVWVPGLILEPMLAVLVRFWALCWWSWVLCRRSWAALGLHIASLGPLLGDVAEKCKENCYLENVLISRAGAGSAASGAVLGRSQTLCCCLEPLLEPMLPAWGRSWGLCSRPRGPCSRS